MYPDGAVCTLGPDKSAGIIRSTEQYSRIISNLKLQAYLDSTAIDINWGTPTCGNMECGCGIQQWTHGDVTDHPTHCHCHGQFLLGVYSHAFD